MGELSFSYLAEYSIYDKKNNKMLNFQLGPNVGVLFHRSKIYDDKNLVYYGEIDESKKYSPNMFSSSSSVESKITEFQFGLTLGVSHQLTDDLMVSLRYYRSFLTYYEQNLYAINSIKRSYVQLNIAVIIF
jgi:hypothetical protein